MHETGRMGTPTGRRHLSAEEAASALHRRAEVEQLLGVHDGIVLYAVAWAAGDAYALRHYRVHDEPDDDGFAEVTGFAPAWQDDDGTPAQLDPEWSPEEGKLVGRYDTAGELLSAATTLLGAVADRWVSAGELDAEYRAARAG